MCALRNVKDLLALNVHARHQDDVSPGQLAFQYRTNVFIDEPDFPLSGHEGRDEEDSLRRHESLNGPHQGKGVIKSTEGLGIGRKNTKNPPNIRWAECPNVNLRG
jgi:hypothetical protein